MDKPKGKWTRYKRPNFSRYSDYNRLYKMVTRCHNPKSSDYINYGGRGITVYKEWITNLELAYEYIISLDGYGVPGLTLDRIDNDGNYEPGNLRWATRREQSLNQRKRSEPSIRSDNTSGHKWINYDNRRCKWCVRGRLNGKTVYIGRYKTLELAVQAQNDWVKVYKR